MDEKGLNKDDLYLLMESYKNMITLNATIVEQQKQLMDNQDKIINKQEVLTTKQTQLCDRMNAIIDRIDIWTKTTKDGHDMLQDTCSGLEETVSEKLDKIIENQNSVNIENTKQHESLKNNMYGAYVALGSIVCSILGLFYFVYSHNDNAKQILTLLQKVAIKLSVNIVGG
jgi:predicted PurR-regulated permease PerM